MFAHFARLTDRARRLQGEQREEAEALAREVGLALMPYVRPRLRSIEAKLTGGPLHVVVEIGGEDE